MKGLKPILVMPSALCLWLLSSSQASAVINCHDYAYYRITQTDCSPPGSKRTNGISAERLTQRLKQMGYTYIGRPKTDAELQHGDILIIRSDHSGRVNSSGTIDHFIQVYGESGVPRDPLDLPEHKEDKPGGLYENNSLNMFVSAMSAPTTVNDVRLFRKTQSSGGPADVWIGTWKPEPEYKQGKGAPMPSLVFSKDGGNYSVLMNGLSDCQISIDTLDAKTFEGSMHSRDGCDYTFSAHLNDDESLSGHWTCTNENGSSTFPLALNQR